MKSETTGTYQPLGSMSGCPTSAWATSWRSRTKVTTNTATVDIEARTAVMRRGTSEAASVYSPTIPMR